MGSGAFVGSGAGHETGRGFVHGTRGGWVRRGSERCTIGTGRANVVFVSHGPVARPVRLVGLRLVFTRGASSRRRFRPRNVDARSRAVDRTHAVDRSHPDSHSHDRTHSHYPPSTRAGGFRLESRGVPPTSPARARAPSRWRTRTRRGVRRVYPHAPHHQQRRLPRAVRRRHFLHGHARRLERSSDRVATEAGAVFAPIPRGSSSSPPSPYPRPRVSPPTGTRGSLPSPSFPFAPPPGWNTRGGTRGTHLLAREPSPRGRRGWATTARGTPTGTRGRTSRRRGARVPRRARPSPVRARRRSRRPSRRARG